MTNMDVLKSSICESFLSELCNETSLPDIHGRIKAFMSKYRYDTRIINEVISITRRDVSQIMSKHKVECGYEDLIKEFCETLSPILYKIFVNLGIDPPDCVVNEVNTDEMKRLNSSVIFSSDENSFTSPIRHTECKDNALLSSNSMSRSILRSNSVNKSVCDNNTDELDLSSAPIFNLAKNLTRRTSELGLFRQDSIVMMKTNSRCSLTAKSKRKTRTPTKRIITPGRRTTNRCTPKRGSSSKKKVQSRKRRLSGKESDLKSPKKSRVAVKEKVVMETPNPKKYRPRWERALVAAAEKTKNEEVVVAESPIKMCNNIASPLQRLKSLTKRPTLPLTENTESPSKAIQFSQSCLSSTMFKAEKWLRKQSFDEISLAAFDSNSLSCSMSLSAKCDTSSQSEVFQRVQSLRRRNSNLFANMSVKSPNSKAYLTSPRKRLSKSPVTPKKGVLKSPKSKGTPVIFGDKNSSSFYLENGHCCSPILTAHNVSMTNSVKDDKICTPTRLSTVSKFSTDHSINKKSRNTKSRQSMKLNRDMVISSLFDEETMFLEKEEFQKQSVSFTKSPTLLSPKKQSKPLTPSKHMSPNVQLIANSRIPLAPLHIFKPNNDGDSGTQSSQAQLRLFHEKLFADETNSASLNQDSKSNSNTLDCMLKVTTRRQTRRQTEKPEVKEENVKNPVGRPRRKTRASRTLFK